MNKQAANTVFTIGHSTRSIEDFIKLMLENNIKTVVDVRTIPRSRHNPQYNADVLPASLKEAGLNYIHMTGLGGLRRTVKDSVNTGWRNASFRGFADYMQTPEFDAALDELIALAKKETIALMCAEALPWRCHRSLIADALFVRNIPAKHIFSHTSQNLHSLTPWAKVEGTTITYPPPESP